MSEFENALKINTNKFLKDNISEENAVTEEEKDWAIVFKSVTRTSFASGARWAREFTVREIIELLHSPEAQAFENKQDYVDHHTFAMWLESHFKDRGGEKC